MICAQTLEWPSEVPVCLQNRHLDGSHGIVWHNLEYCYTHPPYVSKGPLHDVNRPYAWRIYALWNITMRIQTERRHYIMACYHNHVSKASPQPSQTTPSITLSHPFELHISLDSRTKWHKLSCWRHQVEIFSALLAFCAGNSLATGEFPTQRPVMRSFDVFFDLHLNEQLSKQSRRRWF